MPLGPGTRLGPYGNPLCHRSGRDGRGVSRARDTKLGCDGAL